MPYHTNLLSVVSHGYLVSSMHSVEPYLIFKVVGSLTIEEGQIGSDTWFSSVLSCLELTFFNSVLAVKL